jgi:hypothetical protein
MGYISLTKKKVLLAFKLFYITTFLYGCSDNGNIEYQPVGTVLTNEQLGQNVALAILDFPDKRPPFRRSTFNRKSNLVGIFFGYYIGLKIPMRKLYSDQATTIDVIDAIDNSFEANGFNVIRYEGLSDSSSLSEERLAVKGWINEFLIEGVPAWGGTPPSMVATIDIDFTIIDIKRQKTIWTGKIENYRRMGRNRGVFTGTNNIFLFLNKVFSDAIEEAWIDHGMLNALRDWTKIRPQNRNH